MRMSCHLSANFFALAAGPHPRGALSLTPRLGSPVLGSVWPRARFPRPRGPTPAAPFPDASPRVPGPRLRGAAGAFALAAGPHHRGALSLTTRLGFPVLGSVWPQALLHWPRGPTPAARFR